MTDRNALMRAIAAQPDEDTPRLALADLLDEEGENARAAFIRRQVFRSAGRPATWAKKGMSVRRWFDPWWRGRSCWSYHNSNWDLLVARVVGHDEQGPADRFYVRRGMVDEVYMPAADWLAHGPAVVRAHPTVRRVALAGASPMLLTSPDAAWYSEALHGGGGHRPSMLPDALWQLIEGHCDPEQYAGKVFHSAQAASDALSDAALALARA